MGLVLSWSKDILRNIDFLSFNVIKYYISLDIILSPSIAAKTHGLVQGALPKR
jgi:hypothetical protein